MKTIHLHHPYSMEEIPDEEVVLILGYFDGVHRGHQEVIQRGREIAAQKGVKLALMTFDKQPCVVFQKFSEEMWTTLCSEEEKQKRIKKLGVDLYYVVDFTSSFASLLPQEFVDQYIVSLHAKWVVAGFDYTYGPEKADMAHFPDYAKGRFEVEKVSAFLEDGEKVSSTLVREWLSRGNISRANALLGYTYETEGIVVHGEGRGRKLGFPTANIEFERDVRLPGIGVYLNEVVVCGKRYRAMGSIGTNETFGEGRNVSVELNLLDFREEIYGEKVTIFWHTFLRKQEKFLTVEALIRQLEKDQQEVEKFFER